MLKKVDGGWEYNGLVFTKIEDAQAANNFFPFDEAEAKQNGWQKIKLPNIEFWRCPEHKVE